MDKRMVQHKKQLHLNMNYVDMTWKCRFIIKVSFISKNTANIVHLTIDFSTIFPVVACFHFYFWISLN